MPLLVNLIEFFVYRMPLTTPFAWARGRVASTTNIIVVVHADLEGEQQRGIGESSPRGPSLTGDDFSRVGQVLGFAAERLMANRIPNATWDESTKFISEFMAHMGVAVKGGMHSASPKPFRGTLSGIEMALLDLAARAQGATVAHLLGLQRTEIRTSSTYIDVSLAGDQLTETLKQVAVRFPVCRIKGIGKDGAEDIGHLTRIAALHREMGVEKPLWIDINGAMKRSQAEDFIAQIAVLADQEQLPRNLIVEQPVPREDLQGLVALQAYADTKTAPFGGDIVIMADEPIWDAEDLADLHQLGGCRAINIKIQKAGGLLEALRTARRSFDQDPDRKIYLGGFPGTGDITGWAATQLGMAVPRLDYLSAAPPSIVESRVAQPHCRHVAEESNLIAAVTGPGLGVEIDMAAIQPYLIGYHRVPREVKPSVSTYGWHVRVP